MFNLIFGLGGQELLVIGMIILVFFGGKKIPELMRGLGSGIREFNNAKNNIEAEVKENMKEIDSNKQNQNKNLISDIMKPASKVNFGVGFVVLATC